MSFSSFLGSGTVLCALDGSTSEEVISELLDSIAREREWNPGDREEAMVALLKRESIGGTCIGNGIALPHAKLRGLSDFVCGLGISRSGVDFQPSDSSPVHLVFLILSPPDDFTRTPGEPLGHLHLMGMIAALARKEGFAEKVRRCRTPDSAIEVVQAAESELFPE